MLNCIDNSGAALVECVRVLGKKRPATVGAYNFAAENHHHHQAPLPVLNCGFLYMIAKVVG